MRGKFSGFLGSTNGQDAQDLSNFKQPIVSAFCWLSFIVQNFIWKNSKSNIHDLANHKGSQEFWNHLKLMHKIYQKATHNKFEVTIDKLHHDLKNLHSEPDLSCLSPFHKSVRQNKRTLEQQNAIHNSMDHPLSVAEIETTIKLLKPRQITLRNYGKS